MREKGTVLHYPPLITHGAGAGGEWLGRESGQVFRPTHLERTPRNRMNWVIRRHMKMDLKSGR